MDELTATFDTLQETRLETPVECAHCGTSSTDLYAIRYVALPPQGSEAQAHVVVWESCYECFRRNADAQHAHASGLRQSLYKTQRARENAEHEAKLARMSAPEHHEELRRLSAMMAVLGMDLVYTGGLRRNADGDVSHAMRLYGGYDAVDFRMYDALGRHSVARSNLRQCVAAYAEEAWGGDWVTQILAHGHVMGHDDEGQAPGHNAWEDLSYQTLPATHAEVEEKEKAAQERWRMARSIKYALESTAPDAEEAEAIAATIAEQTLTPDQRDIYRQWMERLLRTLEELRTEGGAEAWPDTLSEDVVPSVPNGETTAATE